MGEERDISEGKNLAAQQDYRAASCYLKGCNILSLRAFLTLSHFHRDFLAFVESFAPAWAIDSAEVNENVTPAFLLNKAKTFSLNHFTVPSTCSDITSSCIVCHS